MATKYWIVNQSLLDDLDYSELKQDSVEATRLSVNGLKAVVKSDQIPTGLNADDSLTHAEALALMDTTEWYQPDPNEDTGLY